MCPLCLCTHLISGDDVHNSQLTRFRPMRRRAWGPVDAQQRQGGCDSLNQQTGQITPGAHAREARYMSRRERTQRHTVSCAAAGKIGLVEGYPGPRWPVAGDYPGSVTGTLSRPPKGV